MLPRRDLAPVLDDEALTRDLGDPVARLLVEWLADMAEYLAEVLSSDQARKELARLCRRGRLMARFVRLWCFDGLPGAAAQLAAAERTDWPLPDGPADPWCLMRRLVEWEERKFHLRE